MGVSVLNRAGTKMLCLNWCRVNLLLLCSFICFSIVFSSALMLTCHPSSFVCPHCQVSCECQGFASISWTVTPSAAGTIEFQANGQIGDIKSSTDGLYTGILCDANFLADNPGESTLTSRLNFTFTDRVTVVCIDNRSPPMMVTLQRAGNYYKPCLLTIATV